MRAFLLRARSLLARGADIAIASVLFAGYLIWLLYSARELGYARDEGFYFHAARTYGKWFELLLQNPGQALQQTSVDQYWRENHEHPALMKSLFWLSQRLFGTVLGERGTAFRLPGMLLSAAAVAVTYAFGCRTIGRAGALVAALSFALMPAVFFHSHLACFDMPIVALCLLTVYAYYRSVESRSVVWALLTTVFYGLALNTKHNAWLLPAALGVHALSGLFPKPRERLRQGHAFALVPLALMLLIGPLLFYATWPWIWRDTLDRLVEYVKFHAQHVFYNMEFLGQTYFEPPFPLTYAPLMTLATVPAITLLLVGVGLFVWLRRSRLAARLLEKRRAKLRDRAQLRDRAKLGDAQLEGRAEIAEAAAQEPALETGAQRSALSNRAGWLWLLCILVSYGPWVSSGTPIFGGTKHWMPAYPYLALFAGLGFDGVCQLLRGAKAGLGPRSGLLATAALALCVLAAPFAITLHSHPFGLAAYTPLVGGAPGAATLGLNRTFWGYTTGSVAEFLNSRAAKGDRIFLHDTTLDSFRMLQKDRRLRADLKPWWTVSGSKLALYHHEQHMSRVEYMTWVDYGTTAPAHVAAYDGVPVIWVYSRRRPPAEPAP